jgi:hypothetical protein
VCTHARHRRSTQQQEQQREQQELICYDSPIPEATSCTSPVSHLRPSPSLVSTMGLVRMGRDSILVMSMSRRANTDSALNSWPGPSLSEKTMDVLYLLQQGVAGGGGALSQAVAGIQQGIEAL